MSQLDDILARRGLVHEAARRHKVKRIFVFGSCARREERPESDIDFLVEFEHGATFFDQFRLEDELKALFGREIDVVSKAGLHVLMREEVLREAVEI